MNIQIFGTNKCFDTKKAMRYFKERNIKYQFIDMKEKGLSKGEYNSVKQAVGDGSGNPYDCISIYFDGNLQLSIRRSGGNYNPNSKRFLYGAPGCI